MWDDVRGEALAASAGHSALHLSFGRPALDLNMSREDYVGLKKRIRRYRQTCR
jgi:hypothetical protein